MAEGSSSIADLRAKLNQNGAFQPMIPGAKMPVVNKTETLSIEEHLSLSRATGPKGRRPPTRPKAESLMGNGSDSQKSNGSEAEEEVVDVVVKEKDKTEEAKIENLSVEKVEEPAVPEQEVGKEEEKVEEHVLEKLGLDHARKRSDTRFLGHVDKEANQRRPSTVAELDSTRISMGRRSIVIVDMKDTTSIHREMSNRMHQAQRSQMETLQASLQHTGVHMNASRRRSQQTMLGAMSSAVNMLPQNVDPKALGKKNILSSMDLRSLRVALRATWRRLHHLQGSLASAVTHADSTLSEYDRLKTTLPDALERQESLEDGQAEGERRLSAGDASHNSEEPKDHTKDQAELKKRRRKSVAATRTMLGQAISEFTSQSKEAKSGKSIAEALDVLFASFGVEGTGHRPLPSHQASRVLEALAGAEKRLQKVDTNGLVVQAMLRIIPILRDPDEALELELWMCGDESEDSERGKDAAIWRAALELLAGSDQTMSCFKDGDFLARLKAMGDLIGDSENNRKEAAKLASKADVGLRVEGGKRQQLELAMTRILEKATIECETIRTVHGAADALATATKNRLVAEESPLATPKTINELLNKCTTSVAACFEVDKKTAKKMLSTYSEKMMSVLAQRIKFAEGLVLFAATAASQAEEAAREIARINKVGKQCINAEAEFENWRNGTGGLAEMSTNNTKLMDEILERRKGTGENVLGASDQVVENVNPLFRRMSKSSSLMENRGGSVSEGRLGFGMPVRTESKSQTQRRTSLMVAQLLFLRDHKGAVERRKALEEERKRAAMLRDGDSSDSDSDSDDSMMKNITVRKKKTAMDALMAENSDEDEDMSSQEDEEDDVEGDDGSEDEDDDTVESDDVSMGDMYGGGEEEEEEVDMVSNLNSSFKGKQEEAPPSTPLSALESVELVKEHLRPPTRLRFKDMAGAMRRRLGTTLREGGGHFVFGGSKRAGLRIETPVDALRSTEIEKTTMGSRRVCGDEWICASPTSSGRAANSMSRLAVSVSRVTSSMVRPDSTGFPVSKTEFKPKQQKQQLEAEAEDI